MRPLLNGWRRVGILLVMLWFVSAVSIALVEQSSESHGFFVLQSIPDGTIIEGNKITLPDGKIIAMTEEDEFKSRYEKEKTGKPFHPWEIDFAKLPSVPKVTVVRWVRLGLIALVAPLTAWLFVEVMVFAVAWVNRGFAGKKLDS